MGFRSTLISEHVQHGRQLPKWFLDKYKDILHFGEYKGEGVDKWEGTLPIASKYELKTYSANGQEIAPDLQKVVQEWKKADGMDHEIEFIWFHECSGITKVKVGQNKITYFEPSEWNEVGGITHDYVKGKKIVEVGRARSEKAILREIKKCDLVCSNCHRIRTYITRRDI